MRWWPVFALVTAASCHKPGPQSPVQATNKPSAFKLVVPPAPANAQPPAHKAPHHPPLAHADRSEAKTLYQQRCSLCHGAKGRGDGIAAVNLRPSPRSLADPAWQSGTTDEAIAEILVKGGGAVGKSLMMPPNNDLADRPKVLAAMVELVRSFKDSP